MIVGTPSSHIIIGAASPISGHWPQLGTEINYITLENDFLDHFIFFKLYASKRFNDLLFQS